MPSAAPAPVVPGAGAKEPFESGFPAPGTSLVDTPPLLGGVTGRAVQDAPGVSKFVQNGKTLYTNVGGTADNDKLMSAHPGIQTAPGVLAMPSSANAGASPATGSYGQPNETGGSPGLIIGSGATLMSAANARFNSTPSGSTLGSGRVSGRESARLANAAQIAAGQNAVIREGQQLTAGSSRYATEGGMSNATTAALAQITSSGIGAGATRYHADQSLAGVTAGVAEQEKHRLNTPVPIGQHMEMVNGLPTTMTTYGMPAGATAPLTPINSTPEKPAPTEGSTGKLKDGRKFKIVNGQPVVVQ